MVEETNYKVNVIVSLINNMTSQMKGVQAQLDKLQKRNEVLETKVRKLNTALDRTRTNSKRLTTALLSVMFAGMALNRVFGGMVRGVLDVLGITDMFQATILVLLLPVLEPLSDLLMNIMGWFMDLPEPVQGLIGGFVLLAAGVGAILQYGIGLILFFNGLWTLLAGFISWIGSSEGLFAIGNFIITAIESIMTFLGGLSASMIAAFAFAFAAIAALAVGLWDAFKNNFGGIADSAKILVDNLYGFFDNLFHGRFGALWDNLKAGLGSFLNIVGQTVINTVRIILVGLVSIADAALGFLGVHNNYAGKLNDWITSHNQSQAITGSFATGGIVPETGLAMVHKGETITPQGQSISNSPTINIQASISSDYDVRRLADQLSKYWVNDMERISKSRGMI